MYIITQRSERVHLCVSVCAEVIAMSHPVLIMLGSLSHPWLTLHMELTIQWTYVNRLEIGHVVLR